jgi:hypothetical protein
MSQKPDTMSVEVKVPAGVVNVPIKKSLVLLWRPEVMVVCAPTFGEISSVPVWGAVPPAVSKINTSPPDTPF